MTRNILLALCLITISTFAVSSELRVAALRQLRAIAQPLFEHGESTDPHFDAFYANMVDALPLQERAERALELAINRSTGAAEYVMQNAQSWRGRIKPEERLTALVTTAIDSPLLQIRMAGFEAHLAQYDLDKSPAEVDRLLQRLASDPQQAGPWALWSMGVLGARGVDRERIFHNLLSATKGQDDVLRRWAVDALAEFGGTEVIDPLLNIAVADSSGMVRERAFCGLAQSGTLLLAERYMAVPGLLNIAENPHSDQQTLDWAYQALREITSLRDLPNDPEMWRDRLKTLGLL